MDMAKFQDAFDTLEMIDLVPPLMVAAGGLFCILFFTSRLANIDRTTSEGEHKANSYKKIILIGIFQCLVIAPLILLITNPTLSQALGMNL